MGAVAPEVETVEQPIEFLGRQDDGHVSRIRRCFESFRVQALEQKAEAVALLVQDFHPVARLVEEDEKHWVKHGYIDIEFDKSGQDIDGFSTIDWLGVEIDFFDFGVGSHHSCVLQKEIGSTASGVKRAF